MTDEFGVDAALVRRVAELIGLDVDERRAAELAPQVQAIREDIGTLGAIDVTDVEPLEAPFRPEHPSER